MIAVNNNITYILDKIFTVTLSIFALLNKIKVKSTSYLSNSGVLNKLITWVNDLTMAVSEIAPYTLIHYSLH